MRNELLRRPEAHEGPGGAEETRAAKAAATQGDGSLAAQAAPAPAVGECPSLWRLFRVFLVLGATSFGGGVVAYLRQALVVRERWLDDETFLSGLELAQTLPGLNATNMSVYVGERLRGVPGALVACLGMMLPGSVIVLLLGVLYAGHHHLPDVALVLGGVGAAAVGLTLATTLQIGRKQLVKPLDLSLIVLTFVVIGVLRVPLPIALLTIGPLGVWLYRPRRGAGAASEPGATSGGPGAADGTSGAAGAAGGTSGAGAASAPDESPR
ncbi:MAG TPA: chromate transporter [Candidatus Binatia bacterium]